MTDQTHDGAHPVVVIPGDVQHPGPPTRPREVLSPDGTDLGYRRLVDAGSRQPRRTSRSRKERPPDDRRPAHAPRTTTGKMVAG